MKKRIWLIRFLLSLFFTVLSLVIAWLLPGTFFLDFINVSFLVGLGLLVISGIMTVAFSGFFHAFWLGWKQLFFRENPYSDRSHWSYENDSEGENELEKAERRTKAKYQLFIFLPLFVSVILLIQSFLLLFFL